MDNGFTEEDLIEALANAGLLNQQQQANQQRMQVANTLAQTPNPQGVHTGGPYGTYIAANPLQQLGASARQAIGMHGLQQGLSNQDALNQQYGGDLQKILEAVKAQYGQPGAAAGGGAAPAFVPTPDFPAMF